MMLSERNRRRTQGVSPLMGNIQNRPIHREWVPCCQGLGERVGGDHSMGMGFLSGLWNVLK